MNLEERALLDGLTLWPRLRPLSSEGPGRLRALLTALTALAALLAALVLALAPLDALAHPPGGGPGAGMGGIGTGVRLTNFGPGGTAPSTAPSVVPPRLAAPFEPDSRWRYDDRFNRAQYYPAPGLRVASLPARSVAVDFRGERYWFDAGVWFRAAGRSFVVCDAPVGAPVPHLPPGAPVLMQGGISYYYANHAFYAVAVASPGYVVVPAPDESQAVVLPAEASRAGSDEWRVLPLHGQDQAQLFTDRAGCSKAASEATAYDPMQGATPEDGQAERRYRRIEARCLADRGYLVR